MLCQSDGESRKRKKDNADGDDDATAADKKFKDGIEHDAGDVIAETPNSWMIYCSTTVLVFVPTPSVIV